MARWPGPGRVPIPVDMPPSDTPLLHHLRALAGPLPGPAEALAAQAHALAPVAGTMLLAPGQRWQHLWWVECGALRLYYLDREGRASNKNFFLDGALLWPITPGLAEQPAGFAIEALAPGRVWALPWAGWSAAVAGCARWLAFERQTLARLLEDKMRREQAFLQLSAAERYQALLVERPDWARRIALRHLASFLGVTDVALSRIRRRLNPG